MTIKKTFNHFSLLLICSTFFLLACNNNETELDQNYEGQQRFSFSTVNQNMTATNEMLNSVSAFIFQNNKLVNANPELTLNNGECTLPIVKDAAIYFVANLPVGHLSAITVGMTLEEFLKVRHNESDPATLFFVGHTTITTTSSTTLTIPLTRSLVSFDLEADSEQDIKVSKMNFTQLPTSTTIWENEAVSAASTFHEAELVYATAIGTTADIFRCYESATPVQMTIEVMYKGLLRTVVMTVQSIKRNHKYTIKLIGIGENIVASFEILPWEDGGVIEPDTEK